MNGTRLEDTSRSLHHLYLAAPGSGTPPAVGEVGWIRALQAEATLVREEGWGPAALLKSIHIGGPGGRAPGSSALTRLLEGMGVGLDAGGELALEVEPDQVDPGLLVGWRAAGVTRVNLRWTPGREMEGAALALARAGWGREGGLESWGVDLVFGLGGGQGPHLSERIGGLVTSNRPHQVSLEEAAGPGVDDEQLADEYLGLVHTLGALGYEAWEFTSFALRGRRPMHAQAIWRGESYLGLGAGAHSFDQWVRRWNLDDAGAYITRIGEGRSPLAGSERLAPEARRLEFVWRGLRRARGIPVKLLSPRGRGVKEAWTARGLAHDDADSLRLTPSGWLLLDTLTVALTHALEVDGWSHPDRPSNSHEERTEGETPGAS
jgi:coproporphyrinogen III oxidase-like Fe-S oxidoreductase